MILSMLDIPRVALGQSNWLQVPLLIHVAGGVSGTVTGFVALSVTKGAPLHKRTGIAFMYSMLVMGLFGSAIAALEGNAGSVFGGLLTAYFVVTAVTTVRPATETVRRIDVAAAGVALTIGVLGVIGALRHILSGVFFVKGIPVMVQLILGALILASGLADVRVLRGDGLRGAPRLRRHLWRMCFALFIASGSFFLGQARVIPKPYRNMTVLMTLAFAPLVAMIYWLWRVRQRRKLRGVVLAMPEVAEAA